MRIVTVRQSIGRSESGDTAIKPLSEHVSLHTTHGIFWLLIIYELLISRPIAEPRGWTVWFWSVETHFRLFWPKRTRNRRNALTLQGIFSDHPRSLCASAQKNTARCGIVTFSLHYKCAWPHLSVWVDRWFVAPQTEKHAAKRLLSRLVRILFFCVILIRIIVGKHMAAKTSNDPKTPPFFTKNNV